MKADTMQHRRAALLARYDGRVPRYTSYPTAVQFTPEVGPAVYARWLAGFPADQPVSIYIHVPFCARLCWFCGCNTRVVNQRESIGDYVALLLAELHRVADHLPTRLTVSHIHFGGGTPNMLSPADLDAVFGALRGRFEVAGDAEIASELDPVQLSADWVRAAVGQGLTRASLGVQDLSPDVQAAVNRHEPFEVVRRAADLLRDGGVEPLNLDLMYGLPRQRPEDVLHTLDQVLTLDPSRVALFGYAHVPWMKAHQRLINEAELPGPEDRLLQSEVAAERLRSAGYHAVGLDHFARGDDPLVAGGARRNFQGYTTDAAETLIGLGASAIGRTPQGLVQNHSGELAWRRAIEAGELATARGVAFTADDRFRGEIIERLMCDFAVDLDEIRARHARPASDLADATARLADSLADGVAELDGAHLSITELGRPFVRSVAAVFDAYLDPSAARHSAAV
jgi:oxygen-independent coproporphyrinogen-3 oxidase